MPPPHLNTLSPAPALIFVRAGRALQNRYGPSGTFASSSSSVAAPSKAPSVAPPAAAEGGVGTQPASAPGGGLASNAGATAGGGAVVQQQQQQQQQQQLRRSAPPSAGGGGPSGEDNDNDGSGSGRGAAAAAPAARTLFGLPLPTVLPAPNLAPGASVMERTSAAVQFMSLVTGHLRGKGGGTALQETLARLKAYAQLSHMIMTSRHRYCAYVASLCEYITDAPPVLRGLRAFLPSGTAGADDGLAHIDAVIEAEEALPGNGAGVNEAKWARYKELGVEELQAEMDDGGSSGGAPSGLPLRRRRTGSAAAASKKPASAHAAAAATPLASAGGSGAGIDSRAGASKKRNATAAAAAGESATAASPGAAKKRK